MRFFKLSEHKSTLLIIALICTVIMGLYAQFVMGHFSACFVLDSGLNALGLHFGYDLDVALAFFEMRTESQLICYQDFIAFWDMIFPVVYTAMYLVWIMYFFKSWRLLIIIPLLHMFSDYAENFFEIELVQSYIEKGSIQASDTYWSSRLTIIKWSLSLITYSFIIIGIALKVFSLFKKFR